jgi:predicted DNA-binding protein (MmcQ/YjbR family)
MHIEAIRDYCLSKKGVTESMPFGDGVVVFKVMNKMFALLPLDVSLRINLKMDSDLVPEYREKYSGILPGYHMNKTHWNTVTIEESDVPSSLVKWLIDHSYDEIVKKLPKKLKAELSEMDND